MKKAYMRHKVFLSLNIARSVVWSFVTSVIYQRVSICLDYTLFIDASIESDAVIPFILQSRFSLTPFLFSHYLRKLMKK